MSVTSSTIYSLAITAAKGDVIEAAYWNALTTLVEDWFVQLAEVLGTGCFEATDYNLSINAGALTGTLSAGTAIVGASDARKVVHNTATAQVTGLTGSTTNYVYLQRDGTFTSNTTGTPPANTLLVATCVTNGTEITSVNNLPTGRVNLSALGFLAKTQTWTGQNSFTNATAPIISALIGPTSAQQHTIPAVTSDTVALIAATQTLTNKTINSPTIATPTITGALTGSGDLNMGGGYRQTIDGWYQNNVPASQSAVALTRYVTTGFTDKFIPPRAGSITGLCVKSNEARTAGTLTVEVYVGGVATGLTAVLDGTNTTFKATTQAKDLDVFAAGAEIDLRITTDGSWAPVTADIVATLEIET